VISFLGADPGKTGALVVIGDKSNKIIDSICLDGNGPKEINSFISRHSDAYFLCEKVESTYGDGVKSAFTFGREVGKLEALFGLYDLKIHYVSPNKWASFYRKEYGMVPGVKDNKARNQSWVETFHPGICDFARKRFHIHSGIVDAFLIAHYFSLNFDTIIREANKPKKKKKKKNVPKAMFI